MAQNGDADVPMGNNPTTQINEASNQHIQIRQHPVRHIIGQTLTQSTDPSIRSTWDDDPTPPVYPLTAKQQAAQHQALLQQQELHRQAQLKQQQNTPNPSTTPSIIAYNPQEDFAARIRGVAEAKAKVEAARGSQPEGQEAEMTQEDIDLDNLLCFIKEMFLIWDRARQNQCTPIYQIALKTCRIIWKEMANLGGDMDNLAKRLLLWNPWEWDLKSFKYIGIQPTSSDSKKRGLPQDFQEQPYSRQNASRQSSSNSHPRVPMQTIAAAMQVTDGINNLQSAAQIREE